MKLLDPIIGHPIDKWISKLQFVKEQIETKGLNNTNIHGLQCHMKGTITYDDSYFSSYSSILKALKGGSRNSTSSPSFIQIFKSDDPSIVFYSKTLEFPGHQLLNFSRNNNNNYTYSDESNNANVNVDTSYFNNIMREKLNSNTTNSIIKRYKETLQRLKSELNTQFVEIYNLCKEGKTVCALNYIDIGSTYHAVANIFWCVDDILYSCIYDPLYYIRKKKSYLIGLEVFIENINILGKIHEIPTYIINFSDQCHYDPQKGIHCPQYVIDAEYCMVYSLYFIYLYAAHGFPKEQEGVQQVINDTFISDPAELKRNPCKATNKFRLIMMAFIMNVVLCLTDSPITIYYLISKYNTIKHDGYDLLDKETYDYAMSLISKIEPKKWSAPIQQFLDENPDFRLIANADTFNNNNNNNNSDVLIKDRQYTVLYKNADNSIKQYEGLFKNTYYYDDLSFFSNSPKIFPKKNIIGIFSKKRLGGSRKYRYKRIRKTRKYLKSKK